MTAPAVTTDEPSDDANIRYLPRPPPFRLLLLACQAGSWSVEPLLFFNRPQSLLSTCFVPQHSSTKEAPSRYPGCHPGSSLPPLRNLVINRVKRAHLCAHLRYLLTLFAGLLASRVQAYQMVALNPWGPGSPGGWFPSDTRTEPEFGGKECFHSACGSLGISRGGQPCFRPGILRQSYSTD